MSAGSPEDRLLNLIKSRSSQKAPDGKAAPKPGGGGRAHGPLINPDAIKPDVIVVLNKTLVVTLGLLLLWGAWSIAARYVFTRQQPVAAVAPEEGAGAGSIPASRDQDRSNATYAEYAKEFSGKEIFGAGSKTAGEAPPAPELSKRFNLVGILSDAQPQAIIEDMETKKTYYLNKGQSMQGVTVVEITDKKVVLSADGKEVTLVL